MDRDPDMHLVCSTTSREPRPGEEDGIDMHFRAEAEMRERIALQSYMTALELFGNLYATAPEDCAEHGISIMPMAADAVPMFRALPFRSFQLVYVLPPSYEVWHERIAGRATNELDKRLAEASKSLQFALDAPDVIFVLNDDLDIATESFIDALHEQPIDSVQQASYRELAGELLARISA